MGLASLVDLFYFIQDANQRPDLLNYRAGGAWISLSTESFSEKVKNLSAGLRAMGVRAGDRVGIISNPSPFWVIADFAIMLCGAHTVPIFRRISPENLSFEIQDSALEILFVGDENEYEPVLQYGKGLKKIITIGFEKSGEAAMSFDALMKLGAEDARKRPGLKPGKPPEGKDIATIIYTSGSMGVPKGVMLSHGNLVSQVLSAGIPFPMDKARDVALTSLPLSHIFERMVMYFYLYSGLPVYFADDLSKIGDYAREIRPTIMTVVPRLLEKIFEKMQSSVETARGFKGLIGRAAFKRAETKGEHEPSGGIMNLIYQKLVYARLNGALGGRFRYVICGSAPLREDVARFFLNIGVPLYEGYGLTEASPVVAANGPGHRKLGTVGRAFPSVDIKISSADQEILVKGPNVMQGYLNNKSETASALDHDGYLHTGDMGRLDAEGYLTITGRKKELFKKSTGEYVPPVPIEQALMKLKVISAAVVIAERRKYVSCLIFPDFEEAGKLKEKNGFADMPMDAFLKSGFFRELIQKHIQDVNLHLHHTEAVQAFTVITLPISVETGELTPTLKIARHIIDKKFEKEIEAMYQG